jgi:methanogenic corrinoid protein MtbC1
MMVNQDLGKRSQKLDPREWAISPFLYLGEKLKSFYVNHTRETSPFQMPQESAETLFGVIEGEIIPRLMLAHKGGKPPEDAAVLPLEPALSPDDHAKFLETVMTDSAASTRRFIEDLLRRGVTPETIFLDLLTKAAQRLGELWDEDQCDFTDVTIGLCRLHQVLREQSLPSDGDAARQLEAPRVLLTTACADQHVFGVLMVAAFFRRAGWRVWSEPGTSRARLAAILAEEDFDVIGLSVACTALADDVASEIETFRKASRNTGIKVLVGGRLFSEAPDLVGKIGADAAAFDAKAAPIVGNELLARP